MNLFGRPSADMNMFSTQFGGIAPGASMTADRSREGAHRLIGELASQFGNARNKHGHLLDFEIQVFISEKQNAVCSAPRRTILAGYNEGLKALIAEVSLAIILLRTSPDEFCVRRELFQFVGLDKCHHIGVKAPWNRQKWESLRQTLQLDEAAYVRQLALSNYLLLFVLMHEFMHGLLGHVHLLSKGNLSLFLGETESRVRTPDHRWPLLAEIHADHVAFTSMIKSLALTRGCIFYPDRSEAFENIFCDFVAGICLLYSCWFSIVHCSKGIDFYAIQPGEFRHASIFDGAHLPEPDRLALLFSGALAGTGEDNDPIKRAMEDGLAKSLVGALQFTVENVWPNIPECYAAWQMISHYGLYGDRADELLNDIRNSAFFQEFAEACGATAFDQSILW
jgi:hypothetical protein